MLQGNGKTSGPVTIAPPTDDILDSEQEVVVEEVIQTPVYEKPKPEFPDRECRVGDSVYLWLEVPGGPKGQLREHMAFLTDAPRPIYEYECAGIDEKTGDKVWVRTDKIKEPGQWIVTWFFNGRLMPGVMTPFSKTPRMGHWTFRDAKKE